MELHESGMPVAPSLLTPPAAPSGGCRAARRLARAPAPPLLPARWRAPRRGHRCGGAHTGGGATAAPALEGARHPQRRHAAGHARRRPATALATRHPRDQTAAAPPRPDSPAPPHPPPCSRDGGRHAVVTAAAAHTQAAAPRRRPHGPRGDARVAAAQCAARAVGLRPHVQQHLRLRTAPAAPPADPGRPPPHPQRGT